MASAIAQVLSEDKTTSNLIAQLAEKRGASPEEVTADVSEMFAKYASFLVTKESGVDADIEETRGGIADIAEKYGVRGNKVDTIMDKLKAALPKSSYVPSDGTVEKGDEKAKLSNGKKFKIFLIAAIAALKVMNIIKKNNKKAAAGSA